MFNGFEFIRKLSNANGRAVLDINGTKYTIGVSNIDHTRSSVDEIEKIEFKGEVLAERTNERYSDVYKLAASYGDFPVVPAPVLAEFNKRPNTPSTNSSKFSLDIRNDIKEVIFNDPATIILWKDGTKTVVKVQEGETFDEEKGLAMAIAKRALGDKGNFNEVFKKYVKNEPEKKEENAEDNRGKEGKWIVEENEDDRYNTVMKKVSCSACSRHNMSVFPNTFIKHHSYCPFCGAKMIGVEEKK